MSGNSTSQLKELTIGSKVFVVHNDYAYKNKTGAIVRPGRVTGFKRNAKGGLEIVFKIQGNKTEFGMDKYSVFIDIKAAIQAILHDTYKESKDGDNNNS